MEHSETSDSRPYTTSNIISETSFEGYDQNILQSNQDDNTEIFQNPEPQQSNTLPDQQQSITALQKLPDICDTATIQAVSDLSDVTINVPQSFTITSDSNVLQIPIHNITQNTNNDSNKNDTINNSNQDNTSTLSTANTYISQPSQTQQPSPQNYDPPPLPSQYSTHTTPYNSPQQGSSNTNGTNTLQVQPTVQFQTTTSTRQPILQSLAYTPAQNTQTQIYNLV